jgi:hypothetical protein
MNGFPRVVERGNDTGILGCFDGRNKIAVASHEYRVSYLVRPAQSDEFHSEQDINSLLFEFFIATFTQFPESHLKSGLFLYRIPELAIFRISLPVLWRWRIALIRHTILKIGSQAFFALASLLAKFHEVQADAIRKHFGNVSIIDKNSNTIFHPDKSQNETKEETIVPFSQNDSAYNTNSNVLTDKKSIHRENDGNTYSVEGFKRSLTVFKLNHEVNTSFPRLRVDLNLCPDKESGNGELFPRKILSKSL